MGIISRIARGLGLCVEPAPLADGIGLLFGLRPIARYLGTSHNQARALVAHGAIPTFALDGVVCARKSTIRSHIESLEARHGERR